MQLAQDHFEEYLRSLDAEVEEFEFQAKAHRRHAGQLQQQAAQLDEQVRLRRADREKAVAAQASIAPKKKVKA